MTSREESTPPPSNGRSVAAPVRGATLALTNLFKVTGLVVFVNEAFVRSEARLPILGICLFCMAGAQVSETAILSIIDKFLGR